MSWVIKSDALNMEPMRRAIREFLSESTREELIRLAQPDTLEGQDELENSMGDLLSYLDDELIDSPTEIDYAITTLLPEFAKQRLKDVQ